MDIPTPPYYKYDPVLVLERSNIILYLDIPAFPDKSIDYNRPDILLINNNTPIATIVEIGVPLTHNLNKIEIEKKHKYKELAFQLKNIRKLNHVSIYPSVMSAEGVVSKTFHYNIEKLQLNPNIFTIGQRAILLQTCHIVRKFLN